MMCRPITSRGCPFFSYTPNINPGNMAKIITIAATVVPALSLSKKKSGKPIAAAIPKHKSCLLVKLKSTLDLTFVKSLGTLT